MTRKELYEREAKEWDRIAGQFRDRVGEFERGVINHIGGICWYLPTRWTYNNTQDGETMRRRMKRRMFKVAPAKIRKMDPRLRGDEFWWSTKAKGGLKRVTICNKLAKECRAIGARKNIGGK